LAGINKVLYLAAHGGFDGQAVALGGGAAVFNLLVRQWTGRAPFLLDQVTPAILGEAAPAARDLTRFSESEYARFCRAFSQAATRRVLQEDPTSTAVLVNDVSEGPDFERLAAAGFRIATIYHVDVVAYIARIYLRGAVAPWSLTRLWRALETAGLSKAAPRILKLIFSQQAASVRFSRHLIVPSSGMKLTLRRCYPPLDPARVRVLPWGCPPADCSREDAHREALNIRAELGVPADACIVLALSRISPEKGQDLLLRALLDWERRGLPSRPIWVFICGDAAFMQGAAFEKKLHAMAGRLRKIKVLFPGYVTGARKAGFLSLAGVYVFPSRHESYGLTLMEAMAAGLPSLSLEHDGSRESLPDGCGVMIRKDDPRGVVKALSMELEALINDRERRVRMGRNAALSARLQPFSAAADTLARLLLCENA
jgi:glycosyltransferase involved in cell wall biosynthesis